MHTLKGQTASEYLSNYTIAVVVILIVLAAFTYMGVWDWILNRDIPICIFQKGLDCSSYYIQRNNNIVKISLYNRFDDAIVVSGVICSAEPIDPTKALPYNRNWNDPNDPTHPENQPIVNGVVLPAASPEGMPIILSNQQFEISVYCYTEKSAGIGTLSPNERYKGLVFIQYRLNSSPNIPGSGFIHMIQGNLQGRPN